MYLCRVLTKFFQHDSVNTIRALRIHGTGVVYRFQDVVTKGDADDNRDVIVHMDPVNHF